MITFVCWKWNRPKTGYQLPSICEYTVDHVNTLYSMLKRHMTEDFRLICITDTITDHFCDGVEKLTYTYPLYRDLGGCYRRLIQFKHQIADKWLMIDLDCVITADLVPLVRDLEQYDFAINRYCLDNARRQYYNGALQWHTGARPEVWDKFLGKPSADGIEADPELVGTDQAWISHVLGPDERTLDTRDGIYDAAKIRKNLPNNARIVFFHGARDPSKCGFPWVKEFYK